MVGADVLQSETRYFALLAKYSLRRMGQRSALLPSLANRLLGR